MTEVLEHHKLEKLREERQPVNKVKECVYAADNNNSRAQGNNDVMNGVTISFDKSRTYINLMLNPSEFTSEVDIREIRQLLDTGETKRSASIIS